MFIDLTPLKSNRDFRLLFIGQFVSYLGTMVSYVAIPYQVYELTKDNALVGTLSLVQLLPLLVFGIIGGTYADRLNRRTVILVSEAIMALMVFGLVLNSFMPSPSIPVIFILVAILQAVTGFHRPAMDAVNQKLVSEKHYAALGALGSFRYSVCAIVGPALGGLLIAKVGVKGAFLFDGFTFFAALVAVGLMSRLPNPDPSPHSPWKDAKEGLSYAISKPELIGTYIVDLVAMIFAFPIAVFPAMGEQWGGAEATGVLFSSMAIGSLVISLFSGWTSKVLHHGRGVVIAAALWAIGIIGLGQAKYLWVAVIALACAGAADMVSGLFRGIIWNQTIPNEMRGRLSGIEMISYMAGPLLGNARVGWMAAHSSVSFSVTIGGIICVIAVLVTAALLPRFWNYQKRV